VEKSILGSFFPAPRGARTMNFTIFVPFTHRCYKPYLVEIGSVVPEKKLKMFKSLPPTDDGRKRIAIGHLSDSGDLNIHQILLYRISLQVSPIFVKRLKVICNL
jgi:hypothetical protein